jgi:hypothetical protein
MFGDNSTQDFVSLDYVGAGKKTDLMDLISGKGCQVKSCTVQEDSAQLIHAAKDVAVMYYTVVQDATCAGQHVPAEVWASTVWVKRASKWQATFHQETPIAGSGDHSAMEQP